MYVLALLKWILVLILSITGVLFLLEGFGVSIPLMSFKGLEAHNIPAGGFLLFAAIALSFFWKVSFSSVDTETTTTTYPDGSSKKVEFRREKAVKTFKDPH